jgi:hypothetical protein
MMQRCTCKINSRIAMVKTAFNRKKTLFHQQTGHKFKEETSEVLHLEHRIVSADTWILQKVDQKYLERSEMWCWRRLEKISWTDHVRN